MMKLNLQFSSLCLVLLLSACVTRPVRSDRLGLLDGRHDAVRSSASVDIATNEEPTAGAGEIQLTGTWRWPLEEVKVSSPYGKRGHKFHQGVDLHAPMHTRVLAANDGVVVYVGSKIRGYGRMVVLKHADNFYTVYAHHSKNLVKVGKQVKRGDLIAYSGRSGHASGPHLHFEIRHGTESYDPVYAIKENIQQVASIRVHPSRHHNEILIATATPFQHPRFCRGEDRAGEEQHRDRCQGS